MSTNSPAIDAFVDELRADPQFAEFADGFHSSLTGIDRLGDQGSVDHIEFFDGLMWIAEQPRPLGERLGKMVEFTKLDGHPVVVVMKAFCGW
jgi:hypothetical protein